VGNAEIEARSPEPTDRERPVLRSRPGVSRELDPSAAGRAADPLVASLRTVRTR
jgi:hypothetical protein